MSNQWKMGEFQFDVLREVGNIGAGHAATALSQMISKEIDMKVPQVKIVSFDEITQFVGGEETVVVCVYLRIVGDVPGNMFFILNMESARKLLKQLFNIEETEVDFTELEVSALNEMGNILIGSYLSSLSDFTSLNMQPTPPMLAVDMAAAVLSYGLIELSQTSDYAIAIDTTFLDGGKEVEGHFFFLPDPESLGKVFASLGVPWNENN